jgi:hypothetical protein
MRIASRKHAPAQALAFGVKDEPLNLQALAVRAGRANYSCAALGAPALALARPATRTS